MGDKLCAGMGVRCACRLSRCCCRCCARCCCRHCACPAGAMLNGDSNPRRCNRSPGQAPIHGDTIGTKQQLLQRRLPQRDGDGYRDFRDQVARGSHHSSTVVAPCCGFCLAAQVKKCAYKLHARAYNSSRVLPRIKHLLLGAHGPAYLYLSHHSCSRSAFAALQILLAVCLAHTAAPLYPISTTPRTDSRQKRPPACSTVP